MSEQIELLREINGKLDQLLERPDQPLTDRAVWLAENGYVTPDGRRWYPHYINTDHTSSWYKNAVRFVLAGGDVNLIRNPFTDDPNAEGDAGEVSDRDFRTHVLASVDFIEANPGTPVAPGF